MERFDEFIQIIFYNEGFLSNDKADKGGLTKYGISKRAYPHLDIANLTQEHAEQIYKHDYYLPCKIDNIKDKLLALHVFDFAVNAGISRSIKMLQKVIGAKVDGIIGNQTISLANNGDFAQDFITARINYYKSIAIGTNSKFLHGWLNRVANTTKAL